MGIWWNKLSLKRKLQLPIQLMLVVVLVFAQYVALNKFEDHVLEESRQKALVSADGVLNGLNMLMINGIISDPDQRILYVRKMSDSEKIVELRVIRGKAVQDQFGPGLPSEQPADELDRAALNSAQVQTSLSSQNDRQSLRVVVPFIARKEFRGTNCLMCHMVKEGAVSGAASITLDLSEEFSQISRANYALWTAQIAIQVVLYLLIGWLIGKVTRATRELQEAMQTMNIDGDLSKRVVVRSQDEIGKTAQAFNGLVEGIASIIRQVLDNAARVSSSATQLSASSSQIAQSSHVQSEAAASTAAAVEQITVSINSVAANAEDVRRLSEKSMQQTRQGNQDTTAMIGEIRRVQEAVNQIAVSVKEYVDNTRAITGMTQQVKDIADQTNLLALNVAIEAARAGEQGRSFAVVADEVRKLAEKSARSASEIDQITNSLNQKSTLVETVVQAGLRSLQATQEQVERVYKVLTEAGEAVLHSSHGMSDIAASVSEQSLASTEIARNVEKIAQMSEENHEAVRSNTREIVHLEQLAKELQGAVSRFKV
ncbi:MAG: chemotaxis protein [Betaproteobacteria bacterium RBG_16_56_24]|nr:MAG: chemotaxis protein [Betaproteobacteria bacterium RBG_16_56_24]OGT16994.1 MAG: chemotaxis protein [Gallionellales bacterium RIFCSPHIGHO2_02_FULL_57_16]